jgi:hypothetical protein
MSLSPISPDQVVSACSLSYSIMDLFEEPIIMGHLVTVEEFPSIVDPLAICGAAKRPHPR